LQGESEWQRKEKEETEAEWYGLFFHHREEDSNALNLPQILKFLILFMFLSFLYHTGFEINGIVDFALIKSKYIVMLGFVLIVLTIVRKESEYVTLQLKFPICFLS